MELLYFTTVLLTADFWIINEKNPWYDNKRRDHKGLIKNGEIALDRLVLLPLNAESTAAALAPEGRHEPRTSNNKLSSWTDCKKSSRDTLPSKSRSRRVNAISDRSL